MRFYVFMKSNEKELESFFLAECSEKYEGGHKYYDFNKYLKILEHYYGYKINHVQSISSEIIFEEEDKYKEKIFKELFK